MTPLHRDPCCSLYDLLAPSAPSTHAKHFLLMPPTLGEVLITSAPLSRSCNTAQLDVRLRGARGATAEFDVVLAAPATPRYARAAHAVREGETVFVPRAWWPRVENAAAGDRDSARRGWPAAAD